MCQIIDNFLDSEYHQLIHDVMIGSSFPWFYQPGVAREDKRDEFYFIHSFLEEGEFSLFFELIHDLVYKIDPDELVRVKANLYPRTEQIVEHDWHKDYKESHKAAIYYVNSNDGYTQIGDQRVESVANRLVIFDGGIEHHSTTCSDEHVRVNIGINWKKAYESSKL